MSSSKNDSNYDHDEILSPAEEQEKVGQLPVKNDLTNHHADPQSGSQSKNVSQYFGPEKYPAEYYFKETQKFIRQGQHKKALVILDKFYDRNKNEQFSESVLMKLGRRYLRAGLNILKQYEQRDELHQKSQTIILLKKLSTMIILWYQSLIKILDKNRGYNKEFIVPEEQTQSNTPNPFGSNSNNAQSSDPKKVGPSSFSNYIYKLEREKKEQLKSIYKYPELSLDLIMTDLIDPTMIDQIPDDVHISKNLIEFWCSLLELLLYWSLYQKKMQDAWASYKFLSKAEKFIKQKQIKHTENVKLLDISQKIRMHQGQIFMELSLFTDAIPIYEEALELQHSLLTQQINAKNFLGKDTKEVFLNLANEKIEKTVCKICVCLLIMHQAYEQLDKIEQGMECLRLLYWFSITFIKHPQYSDLLNESYKAYQLFSSKYDELISMNAEINKIFSLVLNRGQKYIISTSDDTKNINEDFLDFVNNHLYKKSKAAEINQNLVILKKKKPEDNSLKLSNSENKADYLKDQMYFSVKSNHSINSMQKLSKINESKETYFTDQNTTTMKGNDYRIDDSLSNSTSHNNMVYLNTTASKKDYQLNKTYNNNNNTTTSEALLTLNEESPDKNYQQQSRIQTITASSFLQPLNQPEIKSTTNLQNVKSPLILSSSSLGKGPQSTSSLRGGSKRFSMIKTIAAFEQLKKKENHQVNWDKIQKNKKKILELHKQQIKEKNNEQLLKYQPKLISSNKFFFEVENEHLTDMISLKNNKELEVEKIFGVHKKKKYNILEHDVDTFADNIIAREILTKSNCIPYNHIKYATQQNLNDYHQEKNEFGFCRKVLQLKKQGMSNNLYQKEPEFNIHDENNEMDREAHDVQNTLLLNNEIQEKKKQLEEAKRIKSLNLDLIPHAKDENVTTKFQKIMFNHSKKLGLNQIKKSLKKITSEGQKNIDQQGQQRSLKNLLFAEEEEQLDEAGKLKKTQNINKETIKLHLTELDVFLQNATEQISKGHKKKYNQTVSDFNDYSDKEKSLAKPLDHSLTIGEKITKDYNKLSGSTKYFIAKNSGQKINSFFDLVNNKMRMGKIQKEEEQKVRMGTPIMKKTLNDAVKRASVLRKTMINTHY